MTLCSLYGQSRWSGGVVDAHVEERGASKLLQGNAAFSLPDHFVWCGSQIKAEEDGRYYLFYSAMEAGLDAPAFSEAWVVGSKIGVAVSDSPYGGFQHLGFILNADGYRPDVSSWDAQSVHNTHIRYFNGRYYLYYIGTCDPGPAAKVKGKLDRRNLLQQNLKIGVISFDSMKELLAGNYRHSDQPLLAPRTRVKANNVLNPSPEGTTPLPDNLIVVNPSVVYRPVDGKYLLYFKGNIYDPGWRGVHGVAISDHPDGPFTPLDTPVLEFATEGGRKLSAEDPFVWWHRKDQCFYAVFKDFTGDFTKGRPALALMTSKDGIHWELPEQSLFMEKRLRLKDGTEVRPDNLERPQLLLDEDGEPLVLSAACTITSVYQPPKRDGSSVNVQIPIVRASQK